MHHHTGKLDLQFALAFEDCLSDPIQAIRFAGRAVMRHFDAPQLFVAAPHPFHFMDGGGVVLVGADEDHVIAIVECAHGVFDHRGNHVVLFPGRHHNRNVLFFFLVQLSVGQRPMLAFDGQRADDFADPVPGIDKQIVQAGDQNHHGHDRNRVLESAVILVDE